MQNNVCKILGDNIKRLRKIQGLKQDELAELLGIEIKSLSLIETGKGFVSAKTLDKLVSVLKIQPADLFLSSDLENAETLYNSILHNLELIKQDSSKLQTVDIVLKSLI